VQLGTQCASFVSVPNCASFTNYLCALYCVLICDVIGLHENDMFWYYWRFQGTLYNCPWARLELSMALFFTFLLSNIDSPLLFNYRFPTLSLGCSLCSPKFRRCFAFQPCPWAAVSAAQSFDDVLHFLPR